MYVEKLTMKDFRCFEQAEVSFVYPGKEGLPAGVLDNVTLLMGINGTGKTSVLKGVAIGVLQPIIPFIGFRTPVLVRRSAGNGSEPKKGEIEGEFKLEEGENPSNESWTQMKTRVAIQAGSIHGDWIDLPAESYSKNAYTMKEAEAAPASFFLLGYGAFRRTAESHSLDSLTSLARHPRYQRVVGLFEQSVPFAPIELWWSLLDSTSSLKVRELLNNLLPEGTSFTGEFKDADALFLHNGVKLPFGALSDGFRSYIGLVADMLYHLNYVCPKKSKLTDLSGVVMIDDIDVHLHPKWQREVVPKLAKTFPKLQFIITSHSPLVAGTLHAANIRVIEDNQVHEYTERIHGLSADQILLSPYFGHIPPRSPDAVNKLNGIADRVADTGDPSAAIEFLNELAGKSNGHPARKPKTGKKK